MLRRKVLPETLRPAWEEFTRQAEQVQAARTAVLSCLPVGRVDRVPVPVGLDLLRDELADVTPRLARWRVRQVEEHWLGCRNAIDEAMSALPRAYAVADSSTELEELLGAVSDVLEPLGDSFAAAERQWRSLRERGR